jgi:hypothetical protein
MEDILDVIAHLLGRQSWRRVTGNDFGHPTAGQGYNDDSPSASLSMIFHAYDRSDTRYARQLRCGYNTLCVQSVPHQREVDEVARVWGRCRREMQMTQSSCNYEGARWAGQMGAGW